MQHPVRGSSPSSGPSRSGRWDNCFSNRTGLSRLLLQQTLLTLCESLPVEDPSWLTGLMMEARCNLLRALLQVLHVIRHGESEYNAATSYGMDFSDPQIFNPKLTEKGRKQVCYLGLLSLSVLKTIKAEWPLRAQQVIGRQ